VNKDILDKQRNVSHSAKKKGNNEQGRKNDEGGVMSEELADDRGKMAAG